MKNQEEEVGNLKSEIADLQNQLREVNTQKKVAKSEAEENQWKAEVKKELDKVLPTAVERGLRDLPFEIVCAYQKYSD